MVGVGGGGLELGDREGWGGVGVGGFGVGNFGSEGLGWEGSGSGELGLGFGVGGSWGRVK